MTEGHLSVKEGKQRGLVPHASVTQVIEEQKQITGGKAGLARRSRGVGLSCSDHSCGMKRRQSHT